MTVYTVSQLKALAMQAGFNADQASVMAAIAMAESDGISTQHNTKPPDDSYGLWQINMLGSMGPERRAWFGIPDNNALFVPGMNARAAKIIFDRQGYHAWSTYGGIKYTRYIGQAKAASPDTSATNSALQNAVNSVGSTASNVASAVTDPMISVASNVTTVVTDISKLGNWLSDPANWLRIAYVVIGGAVTIIALDALFKPITQPVIDSVSSAAVKTAALAAKVAK